MNEKMKNRNKKIDVAPKECLADLNDLVHMETILVAHERQKYISERTLDEVFFSLSVISEQNKLRMKFFRSCTLKENRFVIKYDVMDMVKALDILERSVMEN